MLASERGDAPKLPLLTFGSRVPSQAKSQKCDGRDGRGPDNAGPRLTAHQLERGAAMAMDSSDIQRSSRRKFLEFVAGSPLIPYLAVSGTIFGRQTMALSAETLPASPYEVSSPAKAFDVFDLEEVAHKNLPIAHWAYLAGGVEADATLRANREGFAKFQIRSRRLIDINKLDTSVELFGKTWPTPIVLCPVSSQRCFHPDGEIATARAARARNHLQMLSTVTTAAVEDVIEAQGTPVWHQLYPTTQWEITKALVKRAEAAGCPVLAITVDNVTNAGRETLARGRAMDSRDCKSCHSTAPGGYYARKSMFDNLDISNLQFVSTAPYTWDLVRKVQDLTSMKVILKGIVTAEDANLALRHKVDGIVVSNHGGRGDESGRSTIEALPEVVKAVDGKIPILVDSGFRRGTDIFKALALGANAVCVGRPYIWGLAAFGQAGVERSLEILRAELEAAMKTSGTPSIKSINRSFIQRT